MTRRIVAIAVCFSMVLYTSTRYLATHVLADDTSRMFYPAFGHDLRATVPHVPVPALETVAIARVMGDFHGVTIINNNVAEELTEDATITRGSEIVTGTETGVVFHIGGSRTLYLDRSSRIRFNVLNWFDGDLLVQVEHLDGILINDVAGQLTGSSVHETVILGEDGEKFEVGVLGASYMSYINPSNVAQEEAEQNLAELSEEYGEELNVSVEPSDGALVFFFEGAGTVRSGEQVVEIVVGEGAILSEGEVNVSRFPLEKISGLPQVARNFKEQKRIDVERLAEIDHRSDPAIREKLEQLYLHGFASDKPFFDELSFYEFPVVIEALPEESPDEERNNEQDGLEAESTVQNNYGEGGVQHDNAADSNRITDILVEWSARGESPEVTEPHEEAAILLREDEPGDIEPPENDDDDDNPNVTTGVVPSYYPYSNADVEAESPDYVPPSTAGAPNFDQNNLSEDGNNYDEAPTGLRAIYPQLTDGPVDDASETGDGFELNNFGNYDSQYSDNDSGSTPEEGAGGTYIGRDPGSEPRDYDGGYGFSDPSNDGDDTDVIYDPNVNNDGDGTGIIYDPNANNDVDGTGVIYDPGANNDGNGTGVIYDPNVNNDGDGTGVIYDPNGGNEGNGTDVNYDPGYIGNGGDYGFTGDNGVVSDDNNSGYNYDTGSDNSGYNYNTGSDNSGYNYNTGPANNGYNYNTGPAANNGYNNNTGPANNSYNYNTGPANNSYNNNAGSANNSYNNNAGSANNSYNNNVGSANNGYNYNPGSASGGYNNNASSANSGYNNNTNLANSGYNNNTGSANSGYNHSGPGSSNVGSVDNGSYGFTGNDNVETNNNSGGGNYESTGTGSRENVTTPDIYMRS